MQHSTQTEYLEHGREARAAMLAEERAARLHRALEAVQADAVEIVTHVHTAGHVHELAKRIVRTTSEAMV